MTVNSTPDPKPKVLIKTFYILFYTIIKLSMFLYVQEAHVNIID